MLTKLQIENIKKAKNIVIASSDDDNRPRAIIVQPSRIESDKIIICNGHNTNTGEDEQIMIYLGSKSSSNVSSMYASDVSAPANMSEQNSNANTNAKTTNLIPFYNTASEFITTDVYKSVCEDIGTWYFGNVIVNDKAYRMSGSVFARDI